MRAACNEAVKPYSGALVLLIFLACIGRANATPPAGGALPGEGGITNLTIDLADAYKQGEMVVPTDRFPGSAHHSGGAQRPVYLLFGLDFGVIIAFLYTVSSTGTLIFGHRIMRYSKAYGTKKRAQSRKVRKHRMLHITDSGATFGITKKNGKP